MRRKWLEHPVPLRGIFVEENSEAKPRHCDRYSKDRSSLDMHENGHSWAETVVKLNFHWVKSSAPLHHLNPNLREKSARVNCCKMFHFPQTSCGPDQATDQCVSLRRGSAHPESPSTSTTGEHIHYCNMQKAHLEFWGLFYKTFLSLEYISLWIPCLHLASLTCKILKASKLVPIVQPATSCPFSPFCRTE